MGLKSRDQVGKQEVPGLGVLLNQEMNRNGILESPHKCMSPVEAVSYVLDLEDASSLNAPLTAPDSLDYFAVEQCLSARINELQLQPAPPEEQKNEEAGRLGPPGVVMYELRGNCRIQENEFLSTANFSSLRGNVCVYAGKWMFETQIASSGIMQIGWCTQGTHFTAEDGVGDSSDSYAYDGKRQRKWNVSAVAYGERWTAGDVITTAIDMDEGTIRYWRNGKDLGFAFTNVRRKRPGFAYFPGISLSYGERCEINFGARPFRYPLDDYKPLEAPLDAHLIKNGEYLSNCFARLLDVTGESVVLDSPRSAAARAASHALPAVIHDNSTSHLEREEEDTESAGTAPIDDDNSTHADTMPLLGATNGNGGSSQHHFNTNNNNNNNNNNPDRSNRSILEAHNLPSTSLPDVLSLQKEHKSGGGNSGPALNMTDAVLVSAVLAQHLGPLCLMPYIVEHSIIPLLEQTMWGAGGKERLLRLLSFFTSTLESAELQHLAEACCAALGRTVRCCSWALEDGREEVPAVSSLLLWAAMLENETFRAAWLKSGDWTVQMEALLTVRQPTAADLESLLPHLEWKEGDDYSLVLHGIYSEGDINQDINALQSTLDRLQQAQCQVFISLIDNSMQRIQSCEVAAATALESQNKIAPEDEEQPVSCEEELEEQSDDSAMPAIVDDEDEDALPGLLSDAEPTESDTDDEHDGGELSRAKAALPDVIVQFVEEIVGKNIGAARNVPPPDLSDPSVMPSTFYCLLHLLLPQLERVHIQGEGFQIPTTHFYQGLPSLNRNNKNSTGRRRFTRRDTSMDAYFDFNRLGGGLNYLGREHPPTADDFSPIEVPALQNSRPAWLFIDPGTWQDQDGPFYGVTCAAEDWNWWLWDRLLVMYHLAVAPRTRMAFTHLSTLEQGLNTMQALMDRQEDQAGSAAQELLRLSISECTKTVLESVRGFVWHVTWLLTRWKQEVSLSIAATVSRVLLRVEDSTQELMRFLPELYVDVPLEMMHSTRRSEMRLWPSVEEYEAAGLDSIIAASVALSGDNRIVTPEAKSMLLGTIWVLIQDEECVESVAHNTVARDRLMPMLARLFGDPANWAQAANTLGLLLDQSDASRPSGSLSLDELSEGLGARRADKEILSWLARALNTDDILANAFLNAVFDKVNGTITELVVALEELDVVNRRDERAASQARRKAATYSELTYWLLRVLEFTTHSALPILADAPQSLNATRLAETLAFALRQLATGKAGSILKRKSGGNGNRTRSSRSKIPPPSHLLRPCAQMLICLWANEQEVPMKHCVLDLILEQGLTAVQLDGLIDSFRTVDDDDDGAFCEGCDPLGFEDLIQLVEDLKERAIAAEEVAARSAHLAGGTEEREPPEEFLDPIMQMVMSDPVVLPNSGIIVDRSTIERHLLSSGTDPFSRAPLSKEELQPDEALRKRIESWTLGDE